MNILAVDGFDHIFNIISYEWINQRVSAPKLLARARRGTNLLKLDVNVPIKITVKSSVNNKRPKRENKEESLRIGWSVFTH